MAIADVGQHCKQGSSQRLPRHGCCVAPHMLCIQDMSTHCCQWQHLHSGSALKAARLTWEHELETLGWWPRRLCNTRACMRSATPLILVLDKPCCVGAMLHRCKELVYMSKPLACAGRVSKHSRHSNWHIKIRVQPPGRSLHAALTTQDMKATATT